MKVRVLPLILMVGALAGPPAAAGSGAGAIAYSFNTSTRFEGLGGAGAGAPWGRATNHWANPAQLAFRLGLEREWYRSELAVGLADDIVVTNDEFILAYHGFACLLGRGPAKGLLLDLGLQNGMDENGDPTGEFRSFMKSRSVGLAFDAAQALDLFLSRPGADSHLQRYFSLAVGYVSKDYEDQLAPDSIVQDPSGGGTGEAGTHDLGWLLRVTPLNTLEAPGPFGFLLGAAYGVSQLNGGDEFIQHLDADQADPLPRAHVKGWSLHGEMGIGRDYWRGRFPGFLGSLHQTFNPLISFTYAHQLSEPGYIWDDEAGEYIYQHDTSGDQEEIGKGWELGLANIFYLRRGHFEARYGAIDDHTEGWGINFQVADKFGWRYDQATVPQAQGLPTVDRETWSFWVDPVALFGN